MNDNCPKSTWWGFPCDFEPRYDVIPPKPEALAQLEKLKMEIMSKFDDSFETIIENLQGSNYVGDVCISCGKFIARPTKAPS